MPGVVEALDELAGAGASLAVCTNKRTDLSVALLDALGLAAASPPSSVRTLRRPPSPIPGT